MIGLFGMFLKPFKTPEMDGIFPVLQKSIHFLPLYSVEFLGLAMLLCIFLLPGVTKVIFILKVGKDNYFEAKSFRPISLTSFLLKTTIEKLVDRYIREALLCSFPLSDSQHAYCSGRSTDTALYCLSSVLERTLNH